MIIGVGLAIALLLWLLVTRTRAGMWVRAGASDREMATAMGVDTRTLFTLVFAIGAALCAVAGALLGPLLAVQVGMGENILILAFVVIVIGGIGSIRGALVGSLLVGTGRHRRPRLPAVLFRAMFPVGDRGRGGPGRRLGADLRADGGGALFPAAGPVPGARLMRDTLHIPLRPWPTLTAVAVLALLPLVALAIDQPFYVGVRNARADLRPIATSLNLVIGYGGMVSFGHAAFVGVGAYTVAVLMPAGVVSAWLLWPASLLAGALLRARDRRGLPAHARRLLHHDHARLRADAYLSRAVAARAGQRRGPHAERPAVPRLSRSRPRR